MRKIKFFTVYLSRFFYLITLSLLAAQVAYTQGDAVISGRVYDKTTHEPLAFATITLNSMADSKLVSGTVTNEEGRFSIAGIPQGEYLINCSFIGYGSQKIPVYVGRLNKSFDLGRIELESETAALGEVEVSEKRDLVSSAIDKKSFDIAGNISQLGGSILDVMRNLPGITIDQEGKLELRGSDKVTILVDGKQSSLTGYGNQKGLSSIPASNIDRIEIINNPSAKYEAA